MLTFHNINLHGMNDDCQRLIVLQLFCEWGYFCFNSFKTYVDTE